ncbi:hypothetical protein BDF20DRAFT_908521 [Mycotypha africana]|uniref:uncharacterized protein n=1 Tax=Mycotypha africana TaxID=64632 RepID=UPI0023018E7B|nr:uncharacterized protein BDF20DRAFT_908521 [Mycotypha africana]KAI8967192.1 hypothetical protein BDF20DRAFT_908521 [Mycotypha africana]
MSRFNVVFLLAALLSVQSALAHFQVTYPGSRGFDENKEPTAPCGGFDTVSAARAEVPLKDAFIEINSGHTSYSYVVNVLVNNNPSTADFANTSQAVAVANGSRNYPQAACLSLDLNKNSAIKAGTNGTIQIIYNGGDGELYQCADVTFVDNPKNWNNSMCTNADGSASSSSPSSSGSSPSASATAQSDAMPSVHFGSFFLFTTALLVAFVIV